MQELRVTLECDVCGGVTSRSAPIEPDGSGQVAAYEAAVCDAQDDGWRISAAPKQHLCPECVMAVWLDSQRAPKLYEMALLVAR